MTSDLMTSDTHNESVRNALIALLECIELMVRAMSIVSKLPVQLA
jgi:hypothetical protein